MTFHAPRNYAKDLCVRLGIDTKLLTKFIFERDVRKNEVFGGYMYYLWNHAPSVFLTIHLIQTYLPLKYIQQAEKVGMDLLSITSMVNMGMNSMYLSTNANAFQINSVNHECEVLVSQRLLEAGAPFTEKDYEDKHDMVCVYQGQFEDNYFKQTNLVIWCYIFFWVMKNNPQVIAKL